MAHKSVLLQEIINGLEIKDNEVFVDLTLGNAGHTKAILDEGKENLTIIGIDADKSATNFSEKILTPYKEKHKIIIKTDYFDSIGKVLENHNIQKINKVLIDLGFRSDQIDNPERGFSFQEDGPLLMTFRNSEQLMAESEHNILTAREIVNEWAEESLADIIYGFGEEKFARRIAKKIVEVRNEKPIETTKELAEIIKSAVPVFYRFGKIHPATKTFQAIRIAVNSELERLQKVLPEIFEKLSSGGRIAVISFHSLEDRIVKRFFREKKEAGFAKLINKKPIVATSMEINDNPRSRSAKLRIIEKI